MRRRVILGLDPAGQAPVQGLETGSVGVAQAGEKLGAAGAEEALNLPVALGLLRPGVDLGDAEPGADQGHVVRAIVGAGIVIQRLGETAP